MFTFEINRHRYLDKYQWPCPKCDIWNDIVPQHASEVDGTAGTVLWGTCNVCMEDYRVNLQSAHLRRYEQFQFMVVG